MPQEPTRPAKRTSWKKKYEELLSTNETIEDRIRQLETQVSSAEERASESRDYATELSKQEVQLKAFQVVEELRATSGSSPFGTRHGFSVCS